MSELLYEIPTECNFDSVANNSTSPNECTPKLNDQFFSDFRGLLINAPKSLNWPKNFQASDNLVMPDGQVQGPVSFNVAGLARLPHDTLNSQGDFAFDILVVAVDQASGETYSGKMVRFGFPGPSPQGVEGVQNSAPMQSYFNIDLFHNLDVPLKSACYSVYATLGDYKSNAKEVRVTVE